MPEPNSSFLLRPGDVHVHGTLYAQDEDGESYVMGASAGLDRSAQAACQPHLTPFWATVRADPENGLGFGLLFATGLILVAVPCFYLIADDLRQGARRLRTGNASESRRSMP